MIKGPGSLGTVLVVDDEETNRLPLERLLKSHGYEVLTVASGEAALSTLRQRRVHLVLLDVQMPGANGFDICSQIKRSPETRLIPVALVTGLNDREDKIRGLRAGADDFIAKPFDREELQARVASLVRLKQYTDDLDSTEGISASRSSSRPGTSTLMAIASVWRTMRRARRRAGPGAEDLAALDRGGYLHDIGKIGIPDAVLLKPAALTVEEFAS